MVEFRVLFLVDDLLGRQGGQCLRVPVHHAQASVDVAFSIQVDKDLDYTFRAFLVHGEGRAVPVARCTQSPQLLQDDSAVLVGPVPGMFQKLVAREVALLDAFGSQFLHHLGLGGNRSVVGAGHPQGILPLHACAAHEDVLNGVVEHVPHVKHACHVGRGNHDGVGLSSVGFRTEQAVVKPILVPFSLHFARVVFCC